MVYQRPFEATRQDGVFVFDKCTHAGRLQCAHHTGTHIHHLFVVVCHAFFLDALTDMCLGIIVKEAQ